MSTDLQHDYVLSKKEQLKVYLSNDCRPDGRKFNDVKPIVISTDSHSSSCFGSAMVKWGKTIVSCSVTVQVGTPSPQAPAEGSIVFDVALWSICSPKYDSQRNKKDSEALIIESTLSELYKKTGAIDLTQLCIEPGKSAFGLVVQVVCLSHDGSLLEASVLAASAALARTVLPAVTLDADLKIRISSPSDSRQEVASLVSGAPHARSSGETSLGAARSKPLLVTKHFVGLSISVVQTQNSEYVLLYDPSVQEIDFDLLDGAVSVIVDLEGNICTLKSNSSRISTEIFLQICDGCLSKVQSDVCSLLSRVLL